MREISIVVSNNNAIKMTAENMFDLITGTKALKDLYYISSSGAYNIDSIINDINAKIRNSDLFYKLLGLNKNLILAIIYCIINGELTNTELEKLLKENEKIIYNNILMILQNNINLVAEDDSVLEEPPYDDSEPEPEEPGVSIPEESIEPKPAYINITKTINIDPVTAFWSNTTDHPCEIERIYNYVQTYGDDTNSKSVAYPEENNLSYLLDNVKNSDETIDEYRININFNIFPWYFDIGSDVLVGYEQNVYDSYDVFELLCMSLKDKLQRDTSSKNGKFIFNLTNDKRFQIILDLLSLTHTSSVPIFTFDGIAQITILDNNSVIKMYNDSISFSITESTSRISFNIGGKLLEKNISVLTSNSPSLNIGSSLIFNIKKSDIQ